MTDTLTARELLARLHRHYIKPGEPLPGGMFLPEVTHPAGRRIDALYAGFTRSRGHLLIGHELKVSRSDWLHELDQIDKAEAWASQCHAWYLVVPHESLVATGELPHGWGLMIPDPRTKTRMRIVEKAIVYPDRDPDWPTTHAILKRADTLRLDMAREAREAERASNEEELRRLREQAFSNDSAAAERLRTELASAQARLSEVAAILGLESIVTDRHWLRENPDEISVDELRTQFARFIRAGRDSDRALRNRVSQLDYIRRGLEAAVEGVIAAEKAAGAEARE